jgi:1,4-alpha-glucan branching enzyme
MPGDPWQKFANLRLLLAVLYGQAAKKMIFMGGEFGQWAEWNHDASLDWHLCLEPPHAGLQSLVRDLNALYRSRPALHERDVRPEGFEWIDCENEADSVISFLRRGRDPRDAVLVACNFTPVPKTGYRIGVPAAGDWKERINTDAREYGGSGMGNAGGVRSERVPWNGRPHSIRVALPPLAALFLELA